MTLAWRPSRAIEGVAIAARLRAVLRPWKGRGGKLCSAFVVAVLDELYRLPRDRSMPRHPAELEPWMLARYPHEPIDGHEVEPGDVIRTRQSNGPGHVFIVGPDPGTIWHSDRRFGVAKSGIGHIGHGDIGPAVSLWRPLDKASWV